VGDAENRQLRHHLQVRVCARNGIATLASFAAAAALTGAALGTDGTTTPATTTTSAVPACDGAGLVAILEPGAAAATTVGPALAVSERTGIEPAPFSDTATGVQLADARVGAAGCVNGGPGGATARAGAWSVFGGAVAGTSLRADLLPTPDGPNWHLRAKVEGLTVGGTPADPIVGSSIAVGDWGVLDVHALVDGKTIQPLRYWASALELTLTKAHTGLPAGTRVLLGYVAADRKYAPPPPPEKATPSVTTTTTKTTTTVPATTTAPATTSAPPTAKSKPKTAKPKVIRPKAKPKKAKPKNAKPTTGQPLKGTPTLGPGAYVFPVDGQTDWGDTYGALRSDVPGGWHHGDDLFAPLGTPVVAVADGKVFSVGWNRVGGWRLWLLDANGNQFYYAHLSGYTAAGRNDGTVKKGQVLGFVGNTGDAFTTLPHLHFEVHPSSTLYLGYDGAVNPTSYLRGWPLAKNVVVPPPVRLPSAAPPGQGSAVDFRRLLSIHPLRVPVKAKPAAPPRFHPRVRVDQLPEGGPVRSAAAPSGKPNGGGGDVPIVAGILIALAALTALVFTARAGRASSE
jgi:murein DD-endopeptidase MepM/ murein hydrolase activator NlpD